MNKTNTSPSTRLICLLGIMMPSLLLAQTAEEKKSFDTLMRFKKLISEVINGKINPTDRSTVFAMVLPGIGIHEKRDGSDEQSSAAMPAWVLNTLPSTDLTGNTASTNIAEIYRKVLFDAEPKNPKTIDQLKADQDEAGKFQAQLAPFETAYLEQKLLYAQAQYEYADTRRINGSSSPKTALKQQFRDAATARWLSMGNKVEYDKIALKRDELFLKGSEPWLLWRARYTAAMGSITSPDIDTAFDVRVYPDYPAWTEKSGWMSLEFGGSHLTNYQVKKSFSGSASGGFSILGFGGGASGNYSKSSDVSKDALDSMSFKMEVKRILIARSWGDPLVFRSPNWQWTDPAMRGKAENMISMGEFDPAKGLFKGLMPLYPTSIILARNIEITANFSATDKSNFSSAMSGGAKGGFMFFRAKASASQSSSSSLTEKGDGTATIKIPDAQIIGYICEILPICPAPEKTTKEADLEGLAPADF